ncbi:MAG: hypothetical protein WC649_06400 [Desulfobacteria bacterium]
MGNAYLELVKAQRESQKKYDYYFLAVIVTLLSLSIQSYKPSDFPNFPFIISMVWILLLVSFLAGMYRQERINISLLNEAEESWLNDEQTGIARALNNNKESTKSSGEKWTPQEIKQERERFKQLIDKVNENITKSNKNAITAYGIQKWSFIVSLVLYAALKIVNI